MGSTAKTAVAVMGVAAGVAVALAPIEGLSCQARCALGILVWAIVWWIIRVLPELVVAFIMAVLFMTVASVPVETVLSPFAGSTWWLLLAAFGIGLGMSKSGLVRRMALALLAKFPPTFAAQSAALMAAGTVIGPFFPSMSAKLAVLVPLACGMSDSMGYERRGRQASGLFLATFVGVRNLGPAIISASVIGYAILGLMPEGVQANLSMASWFLAALPWFLIVTVANFAAIMVLFGPRRARTPEECKAQDAAAAKTARMIAQRRAELGHLSKAEKRMLAIVLATVVLWATEPVHGISSEAVGLGAVALSLVAGVFDLKTFRTSMNWESLLFIGIAMGLASVFSYTGIDEWTISLVGPAIKALSFNPYAFVLGIGVATILLRFVIVSEMAYVNIFLAFMVPMAVAMGINPWIAGFAVYATVNPWFALYQNPIYLAAYYAVPDGMVRHAEMAKYCVLYLAICLAALAVSVPYWQMMGIWSLS